MSIRPSIRSFRFIRFASRVYFFRLPFFFRLQSRSVIPTETRSILNRSTHTFEIKNNDPRIYFIRLFLFLFFFFFFLPTSCYETLYAGKFVRPSIQRSYSHFSRVNFLSLSLSLSLCLRLNLFINFSRNFTRDGRRKSHVRRK